MTYPDAALQEEHTQIMTTLYIAFELGAKKWKLCFGNGAKTRQIAIEARDLKRLEAEIKRAKDKLKLKEDCRQLSCYEAGRDGFWLHRHLTGQGIQNLVIDPASIEVNRRRRRAKTDRLDADSLLRLLVRFKQGERKAFSVVNVPSPEEEEGLRLTRELQRLKKEQTAHKNRIRSLLFLHGLSLPPLKELPRFLVTAKTLDGRCLPADLCAEISRELKRLELIKGQIDELKQEVKQRLKEPAGYREQMAEALFRLKGVGPESAWLLVMEFYGWRDFKNGRQIGQLAGLTPTPYDSGSLRREQGISKAGSRRVRRLAVELAWCWLRYQPKSSLSLWFHRRFGQGGRLRRIGIVALARKLLIGFWRFLKHGELPEGALLKAV